MINAHYIHANKNDWYIHTHIHKYTHTITENTAKKALDTIKLTALQFRNIYIYKISTRYNQINCITGQKYIYIYTK